MRKSGSLHSILPRTLNNDMKISDIKLEINKINTIENLTASTYNEDERKGVQSAFNSRARLLEKERALSVHYETMLQHENKHRGLIIAGIDEAGRGPLAG